MSRENVDRIREAYELFERTGEPTLEGLSPEVEIYDHDIPDAGTYRGHAGYLQWISDWSEAWASFNMEPERWIDAGGQVILVLQMTARGKGSGVEVKRRDAMVWTIRDGTAVRVDYYNNVPQALEAAGLPEQAAQD